MTTSRRDMLLAGAALGGAAMIAGSRQALAAQAEPKQAPPQDPPDQPLEPGQPGRDYTPVITPNNVALPWKIVDGVKVYHLIAEEVEHEFAPGLRAKCWGYNGRVHGPTIEAVEGDRVRIYVTNKLPAGTSVHWHGILLPNGMDGVGGLTQKTIRPGETFRYEFTLRQHGTHMYHSHHDEMTQMALGTMGLFIIHPRPRNGNQNNGEEQPPRPDRDFAFMISEWRIDVGTARPNPNEMTDFNIFTFNAKAFPGTEPMVARLGDRVRIRLANVATMSHHPIHLHGYNFRVSQTDGGQIQPSAQQVETTVLTAVGQSRTFDFIANAPGDWPMHCHMTHHVMNQMGHDFPNMIGVHAPKLESRIQRLLPQYMLMGHDGMAEMGPHIDAGHMKTPPNSIPMVGAMGPFDYITMGGLFTILKVREGITTYEDPGWYQHPPGTVASQATADELQRDGIRL